MKQNMFLSRGKGKLFKKISAGFTALAMTLAMVPTAAIAGVSNYSITGSGTVTGALVELTGTSHGNPQTGNDNTQHMAVDWDEDMDNDPTTGTGWEIAPAGDLEFTPVFYNNGGNDKGFDDNDWDAAHTYTTSGTYNITVSVYHGQPTGNDGSDESVFPFEAVVVIDDVCDNIDGVQETVPDGMEILTPGQCTLIPVDLCDNIDGVQETVPDGMEVLSPGQCTDIPVDVCDNIDGDQDTVPDGFYEEGGSCYEDSVEEVTIVATKVVCEDASLLPQGSQNWMPITASTAVDFLDSTEDRGNGCIIDPDWEFQWTEEKVLSANTDQMAGELGGWNTFSQTVTIPMTELGKKPHLSLREVFQPDHIPFSRHNDEIEGDLPSAEFYCSTDGKNYDNMEWIKTPEVGETYYCVAWNVPVEQTGEVTMCKNDQKDNPLSGWQLALLGEKVGEVDVLPDGNEHTIAGAPAGDYVLKATGAYVYRSGGYEADAAFSERKAGDAGFGTYPYQPWRATNPATEHLGVRVNGDSLVWGEVFSPVHTYYTSWNPTDVSNTGVFQITDDAYGDNTGSILVEAFTGYTGVTGENGCVTFSDVPYGDYQIEEMLQVDWENVSGLGQVTVDSEEQTFVVKNRDLAAADTSTIVVTKVVCEDEADLPDWGADGIPEGGIDENTATDFLNDVNEEGEVCYQVVDWQFQWAPESTPDPEDNVGELGEPWTTFTESVTIDHDDLEEGHLVKVREVWSDAYIAFAGEDADTAEPQVSAEMYCDADTLYYDNVDYLENVEADMTYHCIAFNVKIDMCENIKGVQEEVPQGLVQVGDDCVEAVNVVASKIICDDEEYLPDWGAEGIPEGGIDENTAAQFLASANEGGEVCYLDPDWQFQWAPESTPDPEDNVGELGEPWTTFTEGTVVLLEDLGENHLVKIREVWSDAYVAFAGEDADTTEPQVSAEMYCDADTLYYDNVDYIEGVESTGTYYCIAFNALEPIDVCANMDGVQETVPDGYYEEGGDCFKGQVPVDVCDNIDDNQEIVPDGFYEEGGSCYEEDDNGGSGPTVQTDVCPNIPGNQLQIPDGYLYENGQCIGGGAAVFLPGNPGGSGGPVGGLVLGATTAEEEVIPGCGEYLQDYLRMGRANNPEQVEKLQDFLNRHMDAGLPVTGFFGPLTFAAVEDFQIEHGDQILSPWVPHGLPSAHTATGYVFKTTKRWINILECQSLDIPMPSLP